MKKLLFALCGVTLLLTLFAGTSLAKESGAGGGKRAKTPTAEPAQTGSAGIANGAPALNADLDYGFYLWTADGRLNLRTTDRGTQPELSIYTGTITTDGTFSDAQLIRADPGDWAVATGRSINFRFTTYNAVDGVSFKLAGATRLTFKLYRNGHLIRTDHIFIGPGQVNPPGNPFTILS